MTDKLALPVPGLGPKPGSFVIVSATVVVAVSDPDVPVMVTVAGVERTAAEVLAVRVRTSVFEVVPAAKLDVTPEGKPDVAYVIAPLNPPMSVMVMVLVPVPPCATETFAGEGERVKLGGSAAVMVRATVVDALSDADVPVMVTVTGVVVIAAEELAVRVRTSVSDAVPAAKLAVTPAGRPDAVYVIVPLNPPTGLTAIVLDPVPLTGTDTLVGDADSVKFGGTVMVSATVVVSVSEPEVPVTVTVDEPVAAEAAAVSVITSVSDTVPAAKLAVTPVGRPDAVNVTVPVNPPVAVMVTVLVPVPPSATDTLAGEGVSVKPGVDDRVA